MQSKTVSIAPRFCGPTRSGNGGYVCGLLATQLEGAVSVRLFAPPPLDAALTLQSDTDSARLLDGATLLGEARRATLDLQPPVAPTLDEALSASKKYTGFNYHPFPGCFVCGPHRNADDGLRIFTGAADGSGLVVSPWHVNSALAVDGKIPSEIIWAALDCPGAFAVMPDMREKAVVLGQLTARIESSVSADQHCIVIGWPISRDGRKHFAGSAVFDENGKLIAIAKATWIEVEKGRFE